MKKDVCSNCGKELGVLGKVKIKDGYLCKQCSRKYKRLLKVEERAFESVSFEEIKKLKEKDNKRRTRGIIIAGVVVVLMIGLLLLMGTCEDKDEAVSEAEQPKASTQQETTQETTKPKDEYDYIEDYKAAEVIARYDKLYPEDKVSPADVECSENGGGQYTRVDFTDAFFELSYGDGNPHYKITFYGEDNERNMEKYRAQAKKLMRAIDPMSEQDAERVLENLKNDYDSCGLWHYYIDDSRGATYTLDYYSPSY